MKPVIIELDQAAALVLFDLLSDVRRTAEAPGLVVRRPAEQNALAALKTELEKVLVAPLERDYATQLDAARERLERHAGSSAQLSAGS